MNKFVIFTVPRTGSTLLVKTLDSHPQIFCAGELFFFNGKTYHPECQFKFWRLPALNNKLHYLLNYPKMFIGLKGFMNNFYNNNETRNNKNIEAKGFKLMQYQTMYTPGLLNYLKENNVKLILLNRGNILRNALSDLKARATGVYHNSQNGAANNQQEFIVNIQELKNKMEQISRTQKLMEQSTADMNRLVINYEGFNEDWNKSVSSILNFLQVEDIPLSAAVKKLNPDNLQNMITNYDEVKTWLSKNEYNHFLN